MAISAYCNLKQTKQKKPTNKSLDIYEDMCDLLQKIPWVCVLSCVEWQLQLVELQWICKADIPTL